MKLLSLHVENFGKLSGYDHVFSQGLNVIENANAWGKTTLAVFIKAMFYGMDKKGNSKPYDAERSKYLPWQGGTYGGSLMFEAGGKNYRVLRTFAPTPEGDRFELLDLQTNKISKDFSSNLGEELFGVGKETFCLTTFFAQGNFESGINDEVRAHLSGANISSGDAERYTKAVKKLKELSRNTTVATPKVHEIYAAEQQLQETSAQIENLKFQQQKLQQQIEELTTTIQSQPEQPQRVDSSQQKTKQLEELKKKKAQQEKNIQSKRKQNSKSKIKFWVTLGLGVVMAVLTVIFAATAQAVLLTATIGATAGVILLLWTILFIKFQNDSKILFEELNENLNQTNMQISQVEQQILLIVANAEKNLSEFSQQAQKSQDLAIAKIKLTQIENQIETLVEDVEHQDEMLYLLKQTKLENTQKQEIIKDTLEFLQQAKENISQRFVQPMQQKFDELLKKFEEKGNIKLSTDLDAVVDTQIGVKEDKFLSHGKRDLITVCKRFALIENIFSKQLPFVILDDPFVNLDEKALKNMLSLVSEFAKKYQIIYLVCHPSRAK